MEGYWCYWHGGKGYSGVAIHVSMALAPERPAFTHPRVRLRTSCRRGGLARGDRGVGVCAERREGLPGQDAIPGRARRPSPASFRGTGRSLILCGDLNVALTDQDVHPKERKPRAIGQLPEERAALQAILTHDLVDVGRALDPSNDGLFTWWAPWRNLRQRNIGWRIDYILASSAIAGRAVSCPVLADIGTSDHAPLMATFTA